MVFAGMSPAANAVLPSLVTAIAPTPLIFNVTAPVLAPADKKLNI